MVKLPPGVEEHWQKINNNLTMPKARDLPNVPTSADKNVPAEAGHPEYLFTMADRATFHVAGTYIDEDGNLRPGPAKFEHPAELLQCCLAYMDWCEQNPLYNLDVKFAAKAERHFTFPVPRRRIWTLTAMCRFIGISLSTWSSLRKRDHFKDVCEMVDGMIYDQKLEGAAADQFNANVIIRHLGLTDKQEHTIPGGERPVISDEMSAEDAADLYMKEIQG